jgi:hypothetical protein
VWAQGGLAGLYTQGYSLASGSLSLGKKGQSLYGTQHVKASQNTEIKM